jgi:putative membrane protein
MFLVILILICGVLYYYYYHQDSKFESSHHNAIDIVRERYARGEINSEEYHERIKTLESGGMLK